MASLKILHIYKDYYPPIMGGIETHINLLCKYLQSDFDIEILIANRDSNTIQEYIDGIKVTKVGQWGRVLSAPITTEFHRWIRDIPADIYHFHYPNPTAELAYLMAGSPGKLVVTWHSDIVRQSFILPIYKPFLFKFLSKASFIIATSPNYINSSTLLQKYRDKTTIVPLGIEIERFRLSKEQNDKVHLLRRKYNSSCIILFVGRLRYYKGLPILLSAMKDLENFQLLIIGSAPVSTQGKHFESLVEKFQVGSKVHFLGDIPDSELPLYYHLSDIFCLPATHRSEAYGVVQLEAHACGKPVVSTNLDSGVPYVNLNNETGLVVTPGSVEELRKALIKLQKDPKLRAFLGQNAQKRVKTHFTAQVMAGQVKSIYQKIFA